MKGVFNMNPKLNEHICEHKLIAPSRHISDLAKLASNRTIFLSEDVTKESAMQLTSLLLYLDNVENDDIILYLNSRGGDASGLMCIIDVMGMISSPVNTICIGKCYSAGAILLASGTKGKRFAMKHSAMMLHGIQFGFPLPSQDAKESKSYYEYVASHNENIMKILATATGQKLEVIKDLCKRDCWLDPLQAQELGLIDGVI
jgi:ATP-dependent Clp protease, protease subunit